MRLMRNTQGIGKYIVINTTKLACMPRSVDDLIRLIEAAPEAVEFGPVGGREEFFVMKLKDVNSRPALMAYADAARVHDATYAEEVAALAERAGIMHTLCKLPD